MNGIVVIFLFCAGAAQLLLPRSLAALPLLVSFAWIPRTQLLEIGDINVTVFRLVIALGLIRIALRREKLPFGLSAIDSLWLLWSVAMVGTWLLHESNDLMFRLGLVWDYLGAYLLVRYMISSHEDIERIFVALCWVLLPVALLMLLERHSGENPFGVIGGLQTQSRLGSFRAAGPFAHPILAGTVGATCLVVGLGLWRLRPVAGRLGCAVGGAMIYASASSGPILMAAFGLCGLALWPLRRHPTTIRLTILFIGFVLQAVMKDPIYYLMAKIDVVGGSTGWHRSRLIQAAIEHFDEWWLAGTDYTAHWMPTGIQANTQHTDLTNHFLAMGVMGGLPLLIPFAWACWLMLRAVDRDIALSSEIDGHRRFLSWTIGALTVAHAMNFLSAHLFDQSFFSFMILSACVGVIGHSRSSVQSASPTSPSTIMRSHEPAVRSF